MKRRHRNTTSLELRATESPNDLENPIESYQSLHQIQLELGKIKNQTQYWVTTASNGLASSRDRNVHPFVTRAMNPTA